MVLDHPLLQDLKGRVSKRSQVYKIYNLVLTDVTMSRTLPLSHHNAAEWEMRECLLQKVWLFVCCVLMEYFSDYFFQDQQLLRMNNEISRMVCYEGECRKKDELISTLKEELALYQKNLREKDYKLVTTGINYQIINNMKKLECKDVIC